MTGQHNPYVVQNLCQHLSQYRRIRRTDRPTTIHCREISASFSILSDWTNRQAHHHHDFIKKYNIPYANKFGFQKGLSTEYAINSLVYHIIQCLENKEVGYCILLDFAKAFDTVNHEILLHKLDYYGIRGPALNWFKSNLTDRMQCTEIGNTQSKLEYIKSGVPKGSVLGPLLFLLYINEAKLN